MRPALGSTPGACLDEGTGAALVAGELAGDELSAVGHHLDSCDSCQAFAAALANVAGSRPVTPAPEGTLLVGEKIDRYTVLAELGRGASAVVYEVADPKLGRHVALKLMHKHANEQRDSVVAARMLDEARSMARLSHPNVLAVHDTGTAGSSVFIAMELCDGVTLAEWCQGRSPRQRIEALVAAGRGLQAAHAAGIVHRDFKPENVLCGNDGRVLVTDFGLARAERYATRADQAMASELRLTRTGSVVGTPAYMAPEQLDGDGDALSDQFSFCVTLYEAMAGQRPFAGESMAKLSANVRADRVRGPIAPRWLDRIVRRGLSSEPSKRYPSMEALLAAITRGLRPIPWKLPAAVALLAAAGVGGYWAFAGSPALHCEDDANALVAKVWNPERQAQVGEAFVATGAGYADDAWRTASLTLDAYARAIVDHRARTCEDTRDGDLAAVERACYRDRIDALDALLEVFADADPSVVKRASEAASLLPRVESCGDAQTLRRAATSPEVARLQARARALRDTGRYEQALVAANSLRALAHELGDDSSEAEGALVACGVDSRLGKPDEAEDACHQAALSAQRGGDHHRAASAWALLVGLLGNEKGRYEEAERWADYARSAIEQNGGDDAVTAMLANALGVIEKQQGHLDEARAQYLLSLEAFERLHGRDSLAVARTLNNLAILEGKRGERGVSLQRHMRALVIKRDKLGETHPDVAISLLNIGLLESSAAHYLEARKYLEQALVASQAALPAEHPQLGFVHANLGLLEYRLGRYAEARPHLERAVEIVGATYGEAHPKFAVVTDNLGSNLRALGDPEAAVVLHEKAWAIGRKALGDEHSDVLNTRDNLGDALLDLGQSEKALDTFSLRCRHAVRPVARVMPTWSGLEVGSAERSAWPGP